VVEGIVVGLMLADMEVDIPVEADTWAVEAEVEEEVMAIPPVVKSTLEMFFPQFPCNNQF
jgi:hypothetical protein